MTREFLTRIQNKRDTSANWTKNNPVILNGEIILVDTAEGELRVKIGDGTKTYTQLPFSDEVLKSLINTVANTKVDMETGKGLSSNDYTNEDKEKLDGITGLTNAQIATICETGSTGEELEKIIVITNAQIDSICATGIAEANF